MKDDDAVERPTDHSAWRLAAFFEFAGPDACQVGVVCHGLRNHFLSKAQAETLLAGRMTPISLAEPGGPGCQHRLVPISRRVAEALGLLPAHSAIIDRHVASGSPDDKTQAPVHSDSGASRPGHARSQRPAWIMFVDRPTSPPEVLPST
jgi:hypothetical protein